MNKKKIIRHTVDELIGKGNLEIIDKTFSTDYIAHAGEKEFKGHAFIKRFITQLYTSLPDLQVLKVEFFTDDIEKITWQRTMEGTHKVPMQGIPASEKKIKWREMIVSRFKNEKIVEEWIVSELMGELLLKVPYSKV